MLIAIAFRRDFEKGVLKEKSPGRTESLALDFYGDPRMTDNAISSIKNWPSSARDHV